MSSRNDFGDAGYWRTWDQVKDLPHDISGIDIHTLHEWCYAEYKGVWYPVFTD